MWKSIFIILCCAQVLFAKEAEKIQIDISKSKIVWVGKKVYKLKTQWSYQYKIRLGFF